MKLYRTQILLEKSQHELLTEMAKEEGRSLSEVIQEMVARGLRHRQRRQMLLAACELQVDYLSNPELTAMTPLDNDEFLFS